MGERYDSKEDAVYAPPVAGGELPPDPAERAQAVSGPSFVPAPRLSFPVRLAITLGAVLAPVALESIPLPGVDFNLLQLETATARTANVSVGALGLMPVLVAYALVELAALLVPSLRRARHAGPDGRARLHRIAAVVAVLVALFQAYGIAVMLRNRSIISAGLLTLPLTMTAGTCFLWAVAQLVTRYGLGNGIVWLVWVSALRHAVATALSTAVMQQANPGAPFSLGVLVVGIAASIVATRWSCAPPPPRRTPRLPIREANLLGLDRSRFPRRQAVSRPASWPACSSCCRQRSRPLGFQGCPPALPEIRPWSLGRWFSLPLRRSPWASCFALQAASRAFSIGCVSS
ncbi:MAG: hypothetical protein IPK82_33395 [Polyangiaceae bacterium]|nr:hypothetical protein [Polyangiaceae bacterium]